MHDPGQRLSGEDGVEDDEDGALALLPGVQGAAGAPAVHRFVVDSQSDGLRLDKYLALQLPALSRSRLQQWIGDEAVLLNGAAARNRVNVFSGDCVDVREQAAPQDLAFAPEPMPLAVVWEDASIIVIDKPAGLVVHPGAGNWSGTLLNGLLAYDARLAAVPRAGIVHRLDAGTSGLMVVARTLTAQTDLVRQLQARSVVREYWAVVAGALAPSLTIDAALARDPRNPLRFRVSRSEVARPARTFVRRLGQYPVPESAAVLSWLACKLDTGRTHQIRVHLESIGHPLVGDPVYRRRLPLELLDRFAPARALRHQALHACRLTLVHPVSGQTLSWSRPPPDDLRQLLQALGARAAQLRPPAAGYFPDGAAAGAVTHRTADDSAPGGDDD